MNVAFEISPLITASGTFGDKSGVYRYMIGLLKAYIKHVHKMDKRSKVILFSFNRDFMRYPLNPEILILLQNPHVVMLNKIPKIHKKSYIETIRDTIVMDIPLLTTILRATNKILSITKIDKELENRANFKRYRKFLNREFEKNNVKVVCHSDTGFYQMPGFLNITVIYDLTAVTMTHMHREDTNDLQKRKLRFARLWCNGIVCISSKTKKDLIRFSPDFLQKKIVICYPGIDDSFKKRINNSVGSITRVNKIVAKKKIRLKSKKYLLYYGTFEPRKNLLYLVRAFCDLVEEGSVPKDFRLVMTGGEGWGGVKKLIKNYITENYQISDENKVVLLGFMKDDNLIDFIQNAQGIVYPSLYEGFGLPVLESMALSTPVICSKTSSLPEVGGQSVLYIDPHDYYDLKDKMKLLIKDNKLAQDLGKRGHEQSKKFTWENSAKNLYDFVKAL